MSGVSERANGGANGPVLYASISYYFNPKWVAPLYAIVSPNLAPIMRTTTAVIFSIFLWFVAINEPIEKKNSETEQRIICIFMRKNKRNEDVLEWRMRWKDYRPLQCQMPLKKPAQWKRYTVIQEISKLGCK